MSNGFHNVLGVPPPKKQGQLLTSTPTLSWDWQDPVGGSGSTISLDYTFQTATTTPPGSGAIRLNNSNQSAATHMYISSTTRAGVDATNALGAMEIGNDLYVQDDSDSTRFFRYTISGEPVPQAGYFDVPVTFDVAGTTPIANNANSGLLVISPPIPGPPGAQGPAGTPGEKWYLGTGAPLSATGIVGDLYLDTASGDYYEKTASTTWTLRGNLKGPTGSQGATGNQGPAGTPGEKWFTGAGAPAGGLGAVNDWYLDSNTGDYYEKTGATAWTLRGNLKGPQGIQGPTGATGPSGGVPPGGNPGDALVKKTTTDYDTQWGPAGADLVYNGDFPTSTPYTDGDVVVYNGIAYLCVRPTSAAPTPWPGPLTAFDASGFQSKSEKGQPNGYVGLDSASNAQMPGYAYINGAQGIFMNNLGGNGYGIIWAKRTADTQPRFILQDGGMGGEPGAALRWGPGGTTAPDTNLYRSAAGALKTDGHLYAVGNIFLAADNNALYFGAANDAYISRYGAAQLQTNSHFRVNGGVFVDLNGAGNKLYFGSAADTNLYRAAANTLKTDGAFQAVGQIVSNTVGTFSYGGSTGQVGIGDLNTFIGGGSRAGIVFYGATGDTNLYRSAANTLKTDGALLATNTWVKIASVNYNGASWGQTITIPSGIKSVIFIGNVTVPAGGATGFYYRSNGISAACYQCEYSTASGSTVTCGQQIDNPQGLCGIANGDWLNTTLVIVWTSVDIQWSNWGCVWFSLLFTTTGAGGLRFDSGGTLCRNASGAMTSLQFEDGGGRNYTMQGTFWGIPV